MAAVGPYYEIFYFGGGKPSLPAGFSSKGPLQGVEKESRPIEDDDNINDNDPGELGQEDVTTDGVLTKKDLPKFKKSMRCYIEGCRKSFTFGGRSHCRKCGNSVCTEHVKDKVSMALFGYDKGLCLFEKVCTKCHDEAMQKKVGGKLNVDRLLCYIRYLRDRTRWLRIYII